jgi:hypothetical protein
MRPSNKGRYFGILKQVIIDNHFENIQTKLKIDTVGRGKHIEDNVVWLIIAINFMVVVHNSDHTHFYWIIEKWIINTNFNHMFY